MIIKNQNSLYNRLFHDHYVCKDSISVHDKNINYMNIWEYQNKYFISNSFNLLNYNIDFTKKYENQNTFNSRESIEDICPKKNEKMNINYNFKWKISTIKNESKISNQFKETVLESFLNPWIFPKLFSIWYDYINYGGDYHSKFKGCLKPNYPDCSRIIIFLKEYSRKLKNIARYLFHKMKKYSSGTNNKENAFMIFNKLLTLHATLLSTIHKLFNILDLTLLLIKFQDSNHFYSIKNVNRIRKASFCFERLPEVYSNKNQPYLYYISAHTDGSNKLHVKNLQSKNISEIELYHLGKYSNYTMNACLYKTSIFVCGGFSGHPLYGDCVRNCAIYNIKSGYLDNSSFLNLGRSNTSLVSSELSIFCLGGCDRNDICLNSCEIFNFSIGKWKLIRSMNYPNDSITSFYFKPNLIYTFSGSKANNVEMLDENNLLNNWKILSIRDFSKREYGLSIPINNSEILIIGGKEAIIQGLIFNIKLNKLSSFEYYFGNSFSVPFR